MGFKKNKEANKKQYIALQCCQFLTSENSIRPANKMRKNTISGMSTTDAYMKIT